MGGLQCLESIATGGPDAWILLTQLLLVIPLIRISPLIAGPGIRPLIPWLAGVFVFDRLSTLIAGTLLQRLAILVVAGATLALLFRLRGILLGLGKSRPRWAPALLVLTWLALLLPALSILADVFGSVSLALGTLRATLAGVYLAILFRMLYLALEGVTAVSLTSGLARKVRILRTHPEVFQKRLKQIFLLLVTGAWLVATLGQSGMLGLLWQTTSTILVFPLSLGSLSISLGDIVAFVAVVVASFLVSRILRFLLEEQVLPGLNLPRGVPGAISQMSHYTILFLGVLIALKAGGIDLTSFAVLGGAFGVGVGFGLQNVMNNFVSGLILLFERPIQAGDRIQTGDFLGDVEHIGIRASILRTLDGAEVIVPNGNLLSNEVINWTKSDPRRRATIPIGVAYGTDPDRVLALLREVAAGHPKVLEDPAPKAYFTAHGASSLDFEIRAWLLTKDYFQVQSDLAVAVNRALADADIEIPFPQRDLHLRSVDREIVKALGDKDTT